MTTGLKKQKNTCGQDVGLADTVAMCRTCSTQARTMPVQPQQHMRPYHRMYSSINRAPYQPNGVTSDFNSGMFESMLATCVQGRLRRWDTRTIRTVPDRKQAAMGTRCMKLQRVGLLFVLCLVSCCQTSKLRATTDNRMCCIHALNSCYDVRSMHLLRR